MTIVNPVSYFINRVILYTGHSAWVVALLVTGGATLAIAATEVIDVISSQSPGTSDYISMLIKTVPALFILGGVVYMFIKYLEQRDKNLNLMLTRTLDTLNDTKEIIGNNTHTLNELRMDIRRSK